MTIDRVARFDPKITQIVECLMPPETNICSVFVEFGPHPRCRGANWLHNGGWGCRAYSPARCIAVRSVCRSRIEIFPTRQGNEL